MKWFLIFWVLNVRAYSYNAQVMAGLVICSRFFFHFYWNYWTRGSDFREGWPLPANLSAVTSQNCGWQYGVPEISISFDILNSAWLASYLQQTPMWSKMSPLGHRHLTPFFFYAGIQALLLGGTDACILACWDLVCTICDPCDMYTSKTEVVPLHLGAICIVVPICC